mgnify:CR=1 FL=1
MIFSFNSSKSSDQVYRLFPALVSGTDGERRSDQGVYVSVTIAIIATVISTILGTVTAIGLSKSRKVVKELLLNINNIPILNPEIVTAISLMLLFSSLLQKGISDHASGTYSFLYPLCDHQCVSKGEGTGSKPG